MTGAAFAALLATACLPILIALVERFATRPASTIGGRIRLSGASAILAVGGLTAALAASGGPATGALATLTPVVAAVAAVTGGGLVVRAVLRVGGVDAAPAPAPGDDAPEPTDPATSPLRGGRVIGYLERLAVVTTLLVGWPEGLAIILAVKSLARYPELRAAHASEQFILGTFASVLWAAGAAGISHLLLT